MKLSVSLIVAVLAIALSLSHAFDYEVLPLNGTVVDCSLEEPCGQCEGNCESDNECAGELICFTKGYGPVGDVNFIPSCIGEDSNSKTDWCVVDMLAGNPTSPEDSERISLKTPIQDCTIDSPCEQCQGNCESDEECEGDLVCFYKSEGPADDDKYIPSCIGIDESRTDWCVLPDWTDPFKPSEEPTDDDEDDTIVTVVNGELTILAYYYPWYHRDDWSRHGLQGNKPMLGFYGTDEPVIAEQHNVWAEQAGIDTWVVSWWGQGSLTDDHFFKGMLQANNLDKLTFCMLYERGALITNDFADPRALEDMIVDMKYFRDNFFSHPRYFHVNSKPMVVLYLTRGYLNFNRTMVEILKNEVGVDIFFVADTPYFGTNDNPFSGRNGIDDDGETVFEAYTAYNMYTDPRVTENQTATNYMFKEALPIYNNWTTYTTFFPHILPMYHDFRDHPPLLGDAEEMREQLEVFACLNKPQGDKYPNMLFMTSWNEWWEGSQLEPDEAGKYGFTFIDELRRFKDAGPANC